MNHTAQAAVESVSMHCSLASGKPLQLVTLPSFRELPPTHSGGDTGDTERCDTSLTSEVSQCWSGQWSVVSGQRSAVSGQRSAVRLSLYLPVVQPR